MPASPGPALPGLEDVHAAARRIDGQVRETPVLRSEALDRLTGARLVFKAEALQVTGSFKFRGAYNTLAQVSGPAVVTFSSGNHAQGVAAAAARLGKQATIVMPADAPAAKLEGTRSWGADVRLYDRAGGESREAAAGAIAAETGAPLISPYDDARIIAGQGTVGLELAHTLGAWGETPDVVLVPCGGGGLAAGVALAIEAAFPRASIYAVEPEGFDDTTRSLAAARREGAIPGARSICDALLAPIPGELTFEINRRRLKGGLVVSDTNVERAVAAAFRHLKLVVEPGGAVGLAAAFGDHLDLRGRTVAVVLSGGNVDAQLFAHIIGRHGAGPALA